MLKIRSDRVKENASVVGFNDISLLGPEENFQTFSSVCADGDLFDYALISFDTGEWEIGVGRYTEPTNTIIRETVVSTNLGNSSTPVFFNPGIQQVFITVNSNSFEFYDSSIKTDISQLTDNNNLIPSDILDLDDQTNLINKKWIEVTQNYTLLVAQRVIVNTNSSEITLTLPSTANLGDEVRIIDGTGNAAINNIIVEGKIQGSNANLIINLNRASLGLVYYNIDQGWLLIEK